MQAGPSIVMGNERVELSNSITSEDKKLWDILFENAKSNFRGGHNYEISIDEIFRLWGRDKSEEDLKESLQSITFGFSKVVTRKKNDNDYTAGAILSSVRLEDDICYYRYSSFIKQILCEPTIASCLELIGIKIDPKYIN